MRQSKSKMLSLILVVLIVVSFLMVLSFEHFKDGFANAQQIRVACVGDSITEGSGYPAELQQMLGPKYVVESFGVSGSAVSLQSDKPYMAQSAFQEALKFKPNIVVIMLGTNDASTTNYQNIENFDETYTEIVAQFQSLQNTPDLWLAEPPPIFKNTLDLSNENLVEGVIPRIQQVADQLNLPTIDIHTPMVEYDEFFGDGVHPGIVGAVFIANEINSAIQYSAIQDEYP
jgi:lysophospholipase L1-like esterase